MTAPMRMIDEEVARAKYAAHQAKCQQFMISGQRLLARIRASSKYFGQGAEGSLFPVAVQKDEYAIVGGPGGKYRLVDVDLFAVFSDDADPIQITFETRAK